MNSNVVCTIKYVIHTTLDDVARITATIGKTIPIHLSDENKYFIELGIAEALTNIVEHGYAGKELGYITIFWEEQLDCLLIKILDMGRPIPKNLLIHQIKNFNENDTEKLPVNGFGLELIKNIFNMVNYYSIDNINHLQLKIYIPISRDKIY